MDSLVSLARKLGSSPEALEEIDRKFNEQSKHFKKASAAQVDQALADLNPSQHTQLYAELLGVKAGTEIKNVLDFVEQARTLFIEGDAQQLKKATKAVCVICRRVSSALLLFPDRMFRGVLPLRCAVSKISGLDLIHNPSSSPFPSLPSSSSSSTCHVLTPAHTDFALIALKCKAFHAALPIISQPVTQIKPQESGLEPLDYLQYFYYTGMIFSAVKQWSAAMEAYQMALTIPSVAISAVQVACYKKLILVSLIATGEPPVLPVKTTPQLLTRHLEGLAPQYQELSRACKRSLEDLQKTLDVHADVWKKDHSLGLGRQVVESYIRRTIQRLTATYLTLPLTAIAEAAKLPSPNHAKQYINQMICGGEMFAVLNARDGMVSFLDDSEDYDTSDMVARLDSNIRACMHISQQLHQHSQTLALNPQYLARTNTITTGGGTGAGGSGSGSGSGSARSGGAADAYGYDDEDADMKMAMQLSLG